MSSLMKKALMAFCVLSLISISEFAFAQTTPPETKFETTHQDQMGITWKKVLYSEGKSPVSQRQFWTLIEFPLQKDGSASTTVLPTILWHKKASLSGRANEMQNWMQSTRFITKDITELAITNNPLWPLKKDHWDESDEAAYAEWLKINGGEDYITGSGVLADCADYAMTLRWIFAFEKGLPAAQTLSGSGRLFGSWQSTTAWDQLAKDPSNWRKDERFKAALAYLFDSTYTHSLKGDLYPIQINRQYVSPGAIYLTLAGQTGHTRTITNIGADPRCMGGRNCIMVVWGNEPSNDRGYVSECDTRYVPEGSGGFLRFRWPEKINGQWILRAGSKMPGYSKEQFSWNDMNYYNNLQNNLNLWSSLEEQADAMASTVMTSVNARMSTVNEGYYMCSLVPCDPRSELYDNYSTPTRDHNLSAFMASVKGFISSHADRPDLVDRMKSMLTYGFLDANQAPSYWDAIDFNWADLSSDPTQDLDLRWNLKNKTQPEILYIHAQSLIQVWSRRDQSVWWAVANCYANGEDQPLTCDANDPLVKSWNTERLDQGIRAEKAKLVGWIQNLSPAERTMAQQVLDADDGGYGYNVWKLLMVNHQIDRMTSNPTDKTYLRMGKY